MILITSINQIKISPLAAVCRSVYSNDSSSQRHILSVTEVCTYYIVKFDEMVQIFTTVFLEFFEKKCAMAKKIHSRGWTGEGILLIKQTQMCESKRAKTK